MADCEELRATAGQCLALARAASDPRKRITLTSMAQKLYEMAGDKAGDFERAQQEFNDHQLLSQRSVQPQPAMQQQQQIHPRKGELAAFSWRPQQLTDVIAETNK
jgi:hypothetical protein